MNLEIESTQDRQKGTIEVSTSTSMAKNRLQEYCQHNRYGLPVYEYFGRSGGFECKCLIETNKLDGNGNGNGNGNVITSFGFGLNKKSASLQAAIEMLKTIKTHTHRTIVRNNIKTYIFLDLENISVPELDRLFQHTHYEFESFEFIGFLSIGHHYTDKKFEYEGINFKTNIVPNTRSDACDIGMVMSAMRMITITECIMLNNVQVPKERILFVSRDRFSSVFIELLSSNYCAPKFHRFDFLQVGSVSQLEKLLNTK